MADKKEEQTLEEYLQGETALSRQYRAEATQQPARHLDEAILAASRKAIGAKPQRIGAIFKPYLYKPIAWAAVVVICVSLVFNIYRDVDQKLLTTPRPVEGFDQLPITNGRDDTLSFTQSLQEDMEDKFDGLIQEHDAETITIEADSPTSNQPALEADIAPAREAATALEDKSIKPEVIETIGRQKKEQVKEAAAAAPEALGAVGGYRALKKNEDQKEVPLEEATVKREQERKRHMETEEIAGLAPLAAADVSQWPTPEAWLQHINKLWEQGDKIEAEKSLQRFLHTYPYYTQVWLSEQLHKDIDLSQYMN